MLQWRCCGLTVSVRLQWSIWIHALVLEHSRLKQLKSLSLELKELEMHWVLL